jgi:hypothetical protein
MPLSSVPESGLAHACMFCKGELDVSAPEVEKEVTGFVHGDKNDGLRGRTLTGRYAHKLCVDRAAAGISPDQGVLW